MSISSKWEKHSSYVVRTQRQKYKQMERVVDIVYVLSLMSVPHETRWQWNNDDGCVDSA